MPELPEVETVKNSLKNYVLNRKILKVDVLYKGIINYPSVKEFIEKEDYILLSKEYINNSTKLKMLCPNGHECEISYGNFKQGKRCRQCYFESMKWTIDYIENYLLKYGYKLIKEVKQVSKGTRRFLIECFIQNIILKKRRSLLSK